MGHLPHVETSMAVQPIDCHRQLAFVWYQEAEDAVNLLLAEVCPVGSQRLRRSARIEHFAFHQGVDSMRCDRLGEQARPYPADSGIADAQRPCQLRFSRFV